MNYFIFNLETVETATETDQIVVESTISAVENTTTVTETVEVEIVNQEQQQLEQKNKEDEMEHHPTKDEIDEYEESQQKFRELWEKKREKVSLDIHFFILKRIFALGI